MDAKPTIWDRVARYVVAVRAGVVLLAALASAGAYLVGQRTNFSTAGAVLAGCGVAVFWLGVLILLDLVAIARRRRIESMQRVRDFAQRLVIYDRETGLYADWYFRLRLQEEITRSQRFGHPCALLLADSTRGRLGREREAALLAAITEAFRSTDLVAHLGSLRFAALLTNTTPEGAKLARERLEEGVPPGSLNIGIACYPQDGEDWRSLMAAAGGPSADFYAAAGPAWSADLSEEREADQTVA